jgi:hypothetical protein
MRFLLLSLVLGFTFTKVSGQTLDASKNADTVPKLDTLAAAPYINQGKIAGKKAVYRSLIFPGLGQLYNYGLVVDDVKNGRTNGKRVGQKIYLLGKVAAIYGGGTVLVMSFIDNNDKYKLFLRELQYRKLNNNQPDPNNGLANYTNTEALTIAKNIYKRNREVVILSLVGLYGLNVLDAYVTARLKFFNVDETLSLKVSPSIINSNTVYGYQNMSPALKLTLKL